MIVNRTRDKLTRGQPAFGFSLSLGSLIATEALARTPIDFLMIDTQHGSFGPESTTASFMAVATGSGTPIARVARNDYTLVGRLLDEGCLGIVFPMVHTPADAKQAADACRLPPLGTRSWGWGRAARYGADYADWINDQVLVIVQIESIQAVDNAETIMATPGVDACWVGPADLALSMGLDPRQAATDERHVQATERVLQACRNTGKAAGFACNSTAEARQRADAGWQFLTAGSDMGFLLAGANDALKTLRIG